MEDLAKLPYLGIFSQNAHLNVKAEYFTTFSKKNPTGIDKIKNKIGSTIVGKGISKVAQTLVSSQALSGFNAVLFGFNPLMMALTYGLSKSVDEVSKHHEHTSLIE